MYRSVTAKMPLEPLIQCLLLYFTSAYKICLLLVLVVKCTALTFTPS